jgi:hypothetical protein
MQRINDSARERNNNSATQRRKRKYRGRFDFAPTRRREIERHARRVGAAYTDDFYRWLLAWCWHNPKAEDLRWSLRDWSATKLGRVLTDAELDDIIDDVKNKRTRRRCSADNLARWLGLTFEIRKAERITTIGSMDVNKHARKALRKQKDRSYQERKRRARKVQPRALYEANSVAAQARAEGVSRMTIYRRKKAAVQTENAANVTGASAAIFLSSDDARVTLPKTKVPAAYGVGHADFGGLDGDLRILALGLLNHAESAWDSFSKAAWEKNKHQMPRRRRGKNEEPVQWPGTPNKHSSMMRVDESRQRAKFGETGRNSVGFSS